MKTQKQIVQGLWKQTLIKASQMDKKIFFSFPDILFIKLYSYTLSF